VVPALLPGDFVAGSPLALPACELPAEEPVEGPVEEPVEPVVEPAVDPAEEPVLGSVVPGALPVGLLVPVPPGTSSVPGPGVPLDDPLVPVEPLPLPMAPGLLDVPLLPLTLVELPAVPAWATSRHPPKDRAPAAAVTVARSSAEGRLATVA
jgi:hypothetical protein